MARLTSNQAEALHLIVMGQTVYGHLVNKTVPSLLKRGLITQETVPPEPSHPSYYTPGRRCFFDPTPLPFARTVYRLTPEGFAVYAKLWTKRVEAKVEALKAEHQRALSNAKARTKES